MLFHRHLLPKTKKYCKSISWLFMENNHVSSTMLNIQNKHFLNPLLRHVSVPWTWCRRRRHSGGSRGVKCRCSEEPSRSERWSVWGTTTQRWTVTNPVLVRQAERQWGHLVDVVVAGVVEVVAQSRGQHDQQVHPGCFTPEVCQPDEPVHLQSDTPGTPV